MELLLNLTIEECFLFIITPISFFYIILKVLLFFYKKGFTVLQKPLNIGLITLAVLAPWLFIVPSSIVYSLSVVIFLTISLPLGYFYFLKFKKKSEDRQQTKDLMINLESKKEKNLELALKTFELFGKENFNSQFKNLTKLIKHIQTLLDAKFNSKEMTYQTFKNRLYEISSVYYSNIILLPGLLEQEKLLSDLNNTEDEKLQKERKNLVKDLKEKINQINDDNEKLINILMKLSTQLVVLNDNSEKLSELEQEFEKELSILKSFNQKAFIWNS
jgi:hypothetical protein